MQVIDHHQAQPLLDFEPPQLGVDIHEVRARGVVDIQRRSRQLHQRRLQVVALGLVQEARPELLAVHSRRRAHHAREQRFLGHLHREHRHRLRVLGRRHVLRDVQRQRRLPHRRTRRQDNQLSRMEPPGHLVQLHEPGADPLDPLAGVQEGVDPALVLLNDVLGRRQARLPAQVVQLKQRVFRTRQDLFRLLFPDQAPVDQLLRREDNAPQQRLVPHDAHVPIHIRGAREAVVERNEVGQPVAGFQLTVLQQFVSDADAVHPLPALVQVHHADEDAFVLLEREVVGLQRARHLHEQAVIEHDRAEDEALGIQIDGKPFIQCEVCAWH